ncbi:MAG: hypothetical protein OJF55_000239 [Rhodanobacteraceae bacterium]|nr:MAG: hypothetical protein OJF55_000239 [Rhodanobacteraceae bacterium]
MQFSLRATQMAEWKQSKPAGFVPFLCGRTSLCGAGAGLGRPRLRDYSSAATRANR